MLSMDLGLSQLPIILIMKIFGPVIKSPDLENLINKYTSCCDRDCRTQFDFNELGTNRIHSGLVNEKLFILDSDSEWLAWVHILSLFLRRQG